MSRDADNKSTHIRSRGILQQQNYETLLNE